MEPYGIFYFASVGIFFGLLRWRLTAEGVQTLDRFAPNRRWIALEIAILYGACMTTGAFLFYHLTRGQRYAGLGLFGGDAVFVAALVPYLALRRLPVAQILDAVALALPVAMMDAKLGCLVAGCCYGAPTNVPWAVTYASSNQGPNRLPLHPTQGYDAAVFLVAALLVGASMWRGTLVGRRILVLLLVAGLGRATTEALRGDTRPMLGPVSLAQASAAAVAALALAILAVPTLREAWQHLAPPDRGRTFSEDAAGATAEVRDGLRAEGGGKLAGDGARPLRGGLLGHLVAALGFMAMLVLASAGAPFVFVLAIRAALTPRSSPFRRFARIAAVGPWLSAVLALSSAALVRNHLQARSMRALEPGSLATSAYLGVCLAVASMLLVVLRRRLPPECRSQRAACLV